MALLRTITWTCVIGLLAFFVHRELQITTMCVTQEVFIRANRSDVYPSLLDMDLIMGMHPLATGISGVKRDKTEDGLREIQYVIHETVDLVGVYLLKLDISVMLREIQPGTRIQFTGHVSGLLELSASWLLLDYGDGDKDGTLFVDQAEFRGMRFLATFASQEAEKAHRILLEKVKAEIESRK